MLYLVNYLFLNKNGEGLTERGVRYILDQIIKKTSLNKSISPHMLRHSHATELIEVGGWDCLDVKDRLRHRHIQTTINIYVHLSDNYKKEKYKEYQENLRKEDSIDTNK